MTSYSPSPPYQLLPFPLLMLYLPHGLAFPVFWTCSSTHPHPLPYLLHPALCPCEAGLSCINRFFCLVIPSLVPQQKALAGDWKAEENNMKNLLFRRPSGQGAAGWSLLSTQSQSCCQKALSTQPLSLGSTATPSS